MGQVGPCVALFVLACLGCAPELPPRQLTTDHVDYHSWDPRLGESAALARELDDRYEALAAFLGTEPGRIRYYDLEDRGALEHHCSWPDPPPGAGCTIGNQIYAMSQLMTHELVHPFGLALGNPPILFEEGLASVLSEGPWAGSLSKVDSIRDLLDEGYFRGGPTLTSNLGQAMSLTAFLAAELGWPFVLRAHRELPHDAAGAGEWLERETGMSLEELTEWWHSSDAGTRAAVSVEHPYECGNRLPRIDPMGDALEVTLESGVGGIADWYQARATMHLTEPLWVEWNGANLPATEIQVYGCGLESSRLISLGRPFARRWSQLPAGLHAVLFRADAGEAHELRIPTRTVAPPLGPECTSAAPIEPVRGQESALQIPQSVALERMSCDAVECAGWVRFTSEVPVVLLPRSLAEEDGTFRSIVVRYEHCDGCGGPCQEHEPTPAGERPPSLAPVGGEVTLRLVVDRAAVESVPTLMLLVATDP